MDFHSLPRRDLQFLCKRNKIPANITNLAMADSLKSLECVEGLDEYMNQFDSNVLQSPITVAKLPPNTAFRTTRRKTAIKPEQPPSSSHLTSKSLDAEMDQESVSQQHKTNNVVKVEAHVATKTPAARTTRKASCSSKVEESKKADLVQSAYSTRRSTRLMEKCMADLSLKTKETEHKVSAQEKNHSEETSEEADEVIPGRDLSASMEKEWDMLKNDSDKVTGGLETMEVMSIEKESENSLVKQEETLQGNEDICEEGYKKDDNDQETIDLQNCVDLGQIPVLEHANTETNNDNKESKDIEAFESLEQADHLEIEQAIQEIDSEPEKINTFDEEIVVDRTDGDSETEPEEDDAGVDSDSTVSGADSNQETEQAIQETLKINTFDEDTMVDQTDGDSETEPEEDDSGIDSGSIISEADSNQAVQGSDIAEEEMILSEPEPAPTSPSLLLEGANVKAAPLSPFAAEPISAQFPRPNKSATTPSKNSAMKVVTVDNNKENNMEMMVNLVNNSDNGESKGEGKKKKKVDFDEQNLKDVSMRQLVKMVKELSIKGSNNRTALQTLPGNNQFTE